jgi:hypothetical protein
MPLRIIDRSDDSSLESVSAVSEHPQSGSVLLSLHQRASSGGLSEDFLFADTGICVRVLLPFQAMFQQLAEQTPTYVPSQVFSVEVSLVETVVGPPHGAWQNTVYGESTIISRTVISKDLYDLIFPSVFQAFVKRFC